MKKEFFSIALITLFFCGSTWAQDQYEIRFTYDSAGNQTLRDRVCINCGSSKQATDSIPVVEAVLEEDILKEDALEDAEIKESMLAAYPNPVTHILTVEWIASENEVKQIVLLSIVNQQLVDRSVRPGQSKMELDFANYPPGIYIVLVVYGDNSRKSFQVIKK